MVNIQTLPLKLVAVVNKYAANMNSVGQQIHCYDHGECTFLAI